MTLLEKYQKFLVNNTKPEVKPKSLNLSAEGWKLMIRENLTPLIEEKLHLVNIYKKSKNKGALIDKFHK